MSLTNSANWMYSSGGNLFDYEIAYSARMTSDSSSYLERTPSSTGNQRTWTFSCWMKRTELNGGGERIFGAGQDLVSPGNHNNTVTLYFDSHRLRFRQESGGSPQFDLLTNSVFRDMGAWYHIVAVYDSTNGTSGDRARMYVNGERITDLSINDPDPGSSTVSNCMRSGHIMRIGRSTGGYHNHNLAEVHWVDGQALDPTYFGESKSDIWIPKNYTGSHGTNGVHLTFSNSGSMGADSSGNGNTFSTGGLSSTDQILDAPTNNFSTNRKGYNQTASEGNLRFERASNGNIHTGNFPNMGAKTGKWYCELRMIDSGIDTAAFAVVEGRSHNETSDGTAYQYTVDSNTVLDGKGYYSWIINARKTDGFAQSETSYGTALTANVPAIIMCALDLDNGKVWWGKDGTWFNSGNPAAGTNAAFTSSNLTDSGDGWGFASSLYMGRGNAIHIFNYGQDSTFAGNTTAGGNSDANGVGDFKYAPPSGFLAMCSANLPADIDNADDDSAQDYFNTVLWTGTGSGQSITGMGFQPDWLWFKQRNGGSDHAVMDSVRGRAKGLVTNNTIAETTSGASNDLVSFNSDGFTTGTPQYYGSLGSSGMTIATWGWKGGNGTVTNTAGSITSTVSASPESGFSIVTYTGNGTAGATVGHGLGKAPSVLICKRRDLSDNWIVYHQGIASDAATDYLHLDLTNPAVDNVGAWNDTAPSSTVFTLGSFYNANAPGGSIVAYCFADIPGYQKAGSYRGNGSSDGSFIYTGFRPAWVMIKRTDTSNAYTDWFIFDVKRHTYNDGNADPFLEANTTSAEQTALNLDILSNGFKLRDSSQAWNASGGSYIYLAIAEQPLKYANAR